MLEDSVFRRVSVAVVTPFVASKEDVDQPLDLGSFERTMTLVASTFAFYKQSSLRGGIIVSGTTGEQHTMTVEERCRLYECAVKIASPWGIPIAAGIAATTCSAVAQLTKAAIEAGCAGIMLGLPPYCRLCDEEIREYILTVKNLAPNNFPILLYNNSLGNGYGPSLELIAELCRTEVLWGVKHATAPEVFLPQALKLLELEPSIRLYTGSDKMAGDLLDYSDTIKYCPGTETPLPKFYGLTSIIGNIYPNGVVKMVADLIGESVAYDGSSEVVRDTAKTGRQIHAAMIPVLDAILLGCSLPTGLKYVLRKKGYGGGYPRAPVGYLSEAKIAEIDSAVEAFDHWASN